MSNNITSQVRIGTQCYSVVLGISGRNSSSVHWDVGGKIKDEMWMLVHHFLTPLGHNTAYLLQRKLKNNLNLLHIWNH